MPSWSNLILYECIHMTVKILTNDEAKALYVTGMFDTIKFMEVHGYDWINYHKAYFKQTTSFTRRLIEVYWDDICDDR